MLPPHSLSIQPSSVWQTSRCALLPAATTPGVPNSPPPTIFAPLPTKHDHPLQQPLHRVAAHVTSHPSRICQAALLARTYTRQTRTQHNPRLHTSPAPPNFIWTFSTATHCHLSKRQRRQRLIPNLEPPPSNATNVVTSWPGTEKGVVTFHISTATVGVT